MKTSRTYNLPDGKTTRSPVRYARAWTGLGKPVARALGCRLVAVDPAIQLSPLEGGYGFTIPASVAQRIKALLS